MPSGVLVGQLGPELGPEAAHLGLGGGHGLAGGVDVGGRHVVMRSLLGEVGSGGYAAEALTGGDAEALVVSGGGSGLPALAGGRPDRGHPGGRLGVFVGDGEARSAEGGHGEQEVVGQTAEGVHRRGGGSRRLGLGPAADVEGDIVFRGVALPDEGLGPSPLQVPELGLSGVGSPGSGHDGGGAWRPPRGRTVR